MTRRATKRKRPSDDRVSVFAGLSFIRLKDLLYAKGLDKALFGTYHEH